ncbi:MAG: tRNA (cytidine(56)-2'-O)-methyltransferase [Nitrososphaerales archaeon]
MAEVVVLRWGHRLRDERLTTHVILTARALGASGAILSDVEDKDIKSTVEKVVERFGGPFFLKMGIPWRKAVKEWREKGGIVVHLTAYGENIEASDVLERIKSSGKDVMVIVGSQKVPPEFYSEDVSDFNVAVGNEPHSECSALAVFLDRYFEGKELLRKFKGAKVKIIPEKRGKKLEKIAQN